MFETTRDYPAAYISDHGDDAHNIAVRWVMSHRTGGDMPLLYAPGRRNYQQYDLLNAFARQFQGETWKTLLNAGWRGGPVLAVWPDQKHLGQISGDRRTSALCVVAWVDAEVSAWAAAVGAVNLDPGSTTLPPAPQLDPVVRVAVRTLGQLVNHSNALAGSFDKDLAVSTVMTLVEAGYRLDPEAMYAAAMQDGWPSSGADRLKEMSTKAMAGVRLQGRRVLVAGILEQWRAEAQQNR